MPATTAVDISAHVDGGLVLRLTELAGTEEARASIMAMGVRYLVSVRGEDDSQWQIMEFEFREDEQKIAIRGMNRDVLLAHVQQGLVAGETREFEREDMLVKLTASSQQLAQYLNDNHAAVFTDEIAVLAR